MTPRYRIQLYGLAGGEVGSLGRSLHELLQRLAAIHSKLAPWRRDTGEAVLEVRDVTAATEAIAAGEIEWQLGKEKRIAYEARLHLGHPLAPTAELVLTCGIAQPLAGLFAPNRLELLLDAELGSTEVVQRILGAAAEVLGADFGHAGSERVPVPAAPLYSAGVPPVGWMTFLSRRHPPLPESLPEPAVTYAAAGGVLVVAHPDPFRDYDPHHRAAVDAVAERLRQAKILRPTA